MYQFVDATYPKRSDGDHPTIRFHWPPQCTHGCIMREYGQPCNGSNCATTWPLYRLYPHPSLHPVLAMFTHLVNRRANAVKFAHQSLCNPQISTLLEATQRGFIKGCPNINKTLILKYLNPSLIREKVHMKRPRHGIKSMCPKPPITKPPLPQLAQLLVAPIFPLFQEHHAYPGPHMAPLDAQPWLDQTMINQLQMFLFRRVCQQDKWYCLPWLDRQFLIHIP